MSHPPVRRTSEVLQEVIDATDHGVMTIGKLAAMLGDRTFTLAILIFSLPNSLPIPGIPGFSTITGLPITFIAIQMILGKETIWLPQGMANKEFSHATLARVLGKAMPGVVWVEKYLVPRMTWVCTPLAERFIGILFLILSLIIALPIPGGNFLPGLSMSLIAIGLLERDGLFVLCALAFSVFSVGLMAKFIAVVVTKSVNWVLNLF